MIVSKHRWTHGLVTWLIAVAVFVTPLAAFAQTPIKPPSNRYRPQDDVQAGRQAASQVEQQMPILRDNDVTDYVQQIGQRLASAIPNEFQHPEFRYTFKVVNARDINAFALPGGPMYVNRGMIESARTEGEMAGVMAHEISHVALRHGTAQATKAASPKAQLPAIIGAIGGAVLGGTLGNVAAQAGQLGSMAYITKYSREYETQADILGAQIMARAGYDPRDLANMFRTIERQSGGGGGGPEWLSTHPNPGNRYERINQEAALLRVNSNPTQETAQFSRVQSRLRGMGRAPSMQEIAQNGQRNPQNGGPDRVPQGRVEYPSTRYRTYTGGNLFRINVPDNWRELGGGSDGSITFAPEGAYGQVQGQTVFTHGVMVGVAQASGGNLQQATDGYINALAQGNPSLRRQGGYRRGEVAGRDALALILSNTNEATRRPEVVTVYTTMLRNGGLFYMIAFAPQAEQGAYQRTFQDMLRTIQLNDQ